MNRFLRTTLRSMLDLLPRTHTKTRHSIGGRNVARARAMVWSLAFSPDGRSLAIGQQGIDRSASILRIYDLAQRATPSGFSTPPVIGVSPFRRTAEVWPREPSTGFSPCSRSSANGRFNTVQTRVRPSIL